MIYNWCISFGLQYAIKMIINWEHLVLTDQSLLVNLLALHRSRAFSLLWPKDLFVNLSKSWFCLNLCFNSLEIILIMYFLMSKYSKCIGVTAKSRMSMPNSSYFCQTSDPWYSCPCWKASVALKITFFDMQHVRKYSSISFLFHSLFSKWCWAYLRVLLRNLKVILQGLNRFS